MFRWPVVGWVWVPSICTTCLPSTSPSVSKVGPGPSDTNGTVTTASNTPKTRIGTSATSKVRIRLFTPTTLEDGDRFARLRRARDRHESDGGDPLRRPPKGSFSYKRDHG